MDIKIEKNESTITIKASGKLDLDSSGEYGTAAMDAIIKEDPKGIILDFSEISFVSSMGLRIILELYKKIKARNGSFKIKNVSDDIRKSFNLVGFSKFIVLE